MYIWAIQLGPQLLLKHPDTLYTHIFYTAFNKGFVSAQIVHARGNQLLPELLLKPFDTMHTQ